MGSYAEGQGETLGSGIDPEPCSETRFGFGGGVAGAAGAGCGATVTSGSVGLSPELQPGADPAIATKEAAKIVRRMIEFIGHFLQVFRPPRKGRPSSARRGRGFPYDDRDPPEHASPP